MTRASLAEASNRAGVIRIVSDFLGFLGVFCLKGGNLISSKNLGIRISGDLRTLLGVVCFSSSSRLAEFFTSLETEAICVGEDMILELLTVQLSKKLQKTNEPELKHRQPKPNRKTFRVEIYCFLGYVRTQIFESNWVFQKLGIDI